MLKRLWLVSSGLWMLAVFNSTPAEPGPDWPVEMWKVALIPPVTGLVVWLLGRFVVTGR